MENKENNKHTLENETLFTNQKDLSISILWQRLPDYPTIEEEECLRGMLKL